MVSTRRTRSLKSDAGDLQTLEAPALSTSPRKTRSNRSHASRTLSKENDPMLSTYDISSAPSLTSPIKPARRVRISKRIKQNDESGLIAKENVETSETVSQKLPSPDRIPLSCVALDQCLKSPEMQSSHLPDESMSSISQELLRTPSPRKCLQKFQSTPRIPVYRSPQFSAAEIPATVGRAPRTGTLGLSRPISESPIASRHGNTNDHVESETDQVNLVSQELYLPLVNAQSEPPSVEAAKVFISTSNSPHELRSRTALVDESRISADGDAAIKLDSPSSRTQALNASESHQSRLLDEDSQAMLPLQSSPIKQSETPPIHAACVLVSSPSGSSSLPMVELGLPRTPTRSPQPARWTSVTPTTTWIDGIEVPLPPDEWSPVKIDSAAACHVLSNEPLSDQEEPGCLDCEDSDDVPMADHISAVPVGLSTQAATFDPYCVDSIPDAAPEAVLEAIDINAYDNVGQDCKSEALQESLQISIVKGEHDQIAAAANEDPVPICTVRKAEMVDLSDPIDLSNSEVNSYATATDQDVVNLSDIIIKDLEQSTSEECGTEIQLGTQVVDTVIKDNDTCEHTNEPSLREQTLDLESTLTTNTLTITEPSEVVHVGPAAHASGDLNLQEAQTKDSILEESVPCTNMALATEHANLSDTLCSAGTRHDDVEQVKQAVEESFSQTCLPSDSDVNKSLAEVSIYADNNVVGEQILCTPNLSDTVTNSILDISHKSPVINHCETSISTHSELAVEEMLSESIDGAMEMSFIHKEESEDGTQPPPVTTQEVQEPTNMHIASSDDDGDELRIVCELPVDADVGCSHDSESIEASAEYVLNGSDTETNTGKSETTASTNDHQASTVCTEVLNTEVVKKSKKSSSRRQSRRQSYMTATKTAVRERELEILNAQDARDAADLQFAADLEAAESLLQEMPGSVERRRTRSRTSSLTQRSPPVRPQALSTVAKRELEVPHHDLLASNAFELFDVSQSASVARESAIKIQALFRGWRERRSLKDQAKDCPAVNSLEESQHGLEQPRSNHEKNTLQSTLHLPQGAEKVSSKEHDINDVFSDFLSKWQSKKSLKVKNEESMVPAESPEKTIAPATPRRIPAGTLSPAKTNAKAMVAIVPSSAQKSRDFAPVVKEARSRLPGPKTGSQGSSIPFLKSSTRNLDGRRVLSSQANRSLGSLKSSPVKAATIHSSDSISEEVSKKRKATAEVSSISQHKRTRAKQEISIVHETARPALKHSASESILELPRSKTPPVNTLSSRSAPVTPKRLLYLTPAEVTKTTRNFTSHNRLYRCDFDRVVIRKEIPRPPSPTAKLQARMAMNARSKRKKLMKERGYTFGAGDEEDYVPKNITPERRAVKWHENLEIDLQTLPRTSPSKVRAVEEVPPCIAPAHLDDYGNSENGMPLTPDLGKAPKVIITKYLYRGEQDD